jgi:hypothetical protein
VSQQLDALCDLSPVLAPARLKRYKAAAAARDQSLHLAVSSLQQQTARIQAELEWVKQQLAGEAEQLQ